MKVHINAPVALAWLVTHTKDMVFTVQSNLTAKNSVHVSVCLLAVRSVSVHFESAGVQVTKGQRTVLCVVLEGAPGGGMTQDLSVFPQLLNGTAGIYSRTHSRKTVKLPRRSCIMQYSKSSPFSSHTTTLFIHVYNMLFVFHCTKNWVLTLLWEMPRAPPQTPLHWCSPEAAE